MYLFDWLIVAVYLLVSLLIGVWFTRRAGRSPEDFFLARRTVPWWLLGVSMAATNFSIDTPVVVMEIIYREGVSGLWFIWAGLISVMLVTFVFARLWQRSGVMTDVELTEMRYDGQPAAALRLFKGLYFGIVFNVFIIGWVCLAMYKMIQGIFPDHSLWILGGITVLALVYSVSGGFFSVLVTDLLQYIIATVGSISLAVLAVCKVGGVKQLLLQLAENPDVPKDVTHVLPNVGQTGNMTLLALGTYLMVQWWAQKYSDGGGKHIQRMLSARSEGDAVAGTFLYAALNFTIQLWPWVIVGLCSMVLLGPAEKQDPLLVYPKMMSLVLPVGLMGLCVSGLLGAFMSTIDTHLNLGASYLVNDLYRRFIRRQASDAHYVFVSRVAMVLLLIGSISVGLMMDSVLGAWQFLLTFAGGAGATWIIRWFWWRANAWTEFAGMFASGITATAMHWIAPDWHYTSRLLVTVAVSTTAWVIATFLTRPTDDATLIAFVQKVRPPQWGWTRVYAMAGIQAPVWLHRELIAAFFGLVSLLSMCFAIGQFILGDPVFGAALLVMTFSSAAVVIVTEFRSVKTLLHQ